MQHPPLPYLTDVRAIDTLAVDTEHPPVGGLELQSGLVPCISTRRLECPLGQSREETYVARYATNRCGQRLDSPIGDYSVHTVNHVVDSAIGVEIWPTGD